MAKPTIEENPEAAFEQFKEQLRKAPMSQVVSIGRALQLEKRTFQIAASILQGRRKISDLPLDDALSAVKMLHLIHKEIEHGRTVPGEILAATKRRRPRINHFGGGDFFRGGCENPVNRVSGVCMKQR